MGNLKTTTTANPAYGIIRNYSYEGANYALYFHNGELCFAMLHKNKKAVVKTTIENWHGLETLYQEIKLDKRNLTENQARQFLYYYHYDEDRFEFAHGQYLYTEDYKGNKVKPHIGIMTSKIPVWEKVFADILTITPRNETQDLANLDPIATLQLSKPPETFTQIMSKQRI